MGNNEELHLSYFMAQTGFNREQAERNYKYVKRVSKYYGITLKASVDRIREAIIEKEEKR